MLVRSNLAVCVRTPSTAERVTLWSLRERLEGGPGATRLAEGVRRVFGLAHVEPALAALEEVFRLLSSSLHARLELLRPGCPALSRDEERVLEVLACAQRGDEPGVRAGSEALVGSCRAAELGRALHAFAALLKAEQLLLPAVAPASAPARSALPPAMSRAPRAPVRRGQQPSS